MSAAGARARDRGRRAPGQPTASWSPSQTNAATRAVGIAVLDQSLPELLDTLLPDTLSSSRQLAAAARHLRTSEPLSHEISNGSSRDLLRTAVARLEPSRHRASSAAVAAMATSCAGCSASVSGWRSGKATCEVCSKQYCSGCCYHYVSLASAPTTQGASAAAHPSSCPAALLTSRCHACAAADSACCTTHTVLACNACFLKSVNWDAARTHDVYGPEDGQPVVLVHGALIGRQCLAGEARALADAGYRCGG